MLGLPVIALALLLAGPALWAGFVTGTMNENDALIRFLIAIPIAAVGVGAIRSLTQGYANAARRKERDALRAAKLKEITDAKKAKPA